MCVDGGVGVRQPICSSAFVGVFSRPGGVIVLGVTTPTLEGIEDSEEVNLQEGAWVVTYHRQCYDDAILDCGPSYLVRQDGTTTAIPNDS